MIRSFGANFSTKLDLGRYISVWNAVRIPIFHISHTKIEKLCFSTPWLIKRTGIVLYTNIIVFTH
ncbi:hypothetical protein D3C78_1875630 [compost metagenome]